MKDFNLPRNWKYSSPETQGFHEVITPENSACKLTWIYRLNLEPGDAFTLQNDRLELNGVSVAGRCQLELDNELYQLEKLDSFYLPGGVKAVITAIDRLSMFIGGSLFEGKGKTFVRKYDLAMPTGIIRQVHGVPPYRRDVFMCVNQGAEASRIITGITVGDAGMWTSWPPHQHSDHLEEVYCYFDIPEPKSAFHFASRVAGKFEAIHPVSTGDCVVIPEGYHPTLGMPGVKSSYFWIMSAFKPESRRYDLAINDPNFE